MVPPPVVCTGHMSHRARAHKDQLAVSAQLQLVGPLQEKQTSEKEHRHHRRGRETLTGYGQAAVEGVASEASATGANGTVVEYTAQSLLATRARTGIDTLLGHTRLVLGTLRGDGALGATGWRRTNIFGQARADRLLIEFSTL